jgi:hypothetical protein
MAKTKISSTELTWIFYEKLKATHECPDGLPIAIIPDSECGWRAVINPRDGTRHRPCGRRVQAIQKQLREIYVLKND